MSLNVLYRQGHRLKFKEGAHIPLLPSQDYMNSDTYGHCLSEKVISNWSGLPRYDYFVRDM